MNKAIGYNGRELVSGKIDPPGEILREEIAERKITQSSFAKKIGIHQPHFSDILKGKRKINALLALKLEKELGVRAEFWLEMQVQYELALEREKLQDVA